MTSDFKETSISTGENTMISLPLDKTHLIGKSEKEIIQLFKTFYIENNKWFVFKKVSKDERANILEGVFSDEEGALLFISTVLPRGQYITKNFTHYLGINYND